ncbi:MAG: AarF/ABC1/UbiB kinase family protein [Flavobacteriales bacterium]|nr:AarF/ABC1/UbiB kinase family protein [Flavobacteriales bacterium]
MEINNSQDKIPTSKVARATRFFSAGAKVGGNYIRHYVKKAFDPTIEKSELDKANAEDIYKALSELKGSALKMAQMLAMDRNILPTEYIQEFQKAQYKAPPLSGPLIVQTFQRTIGKSPHELFDSFDEKAVNAASIGQVHQATKNGKKLAVKIQYPGVANSVVSDLKLVKPFALRLMNVKESEIKPYFDEIQSKLLEEADYCAEVKNSIFISEHCRHLPNLHFPVYYPEWSSDKVIVMDWVEGIPLVEFLKSEPPRELRNRIGQAMWDFYDYQMHHLRLIHADPHPGNFFITPDNKLGIIDFGCVKEVPEDFYHRYFALLDEENFYNPQAMARRLKEVEILNDQSSHEEIAFFTKTFQLMLGYLKKPFESTTFDFGDDRYICEIMELGEKIGTSPEARKFSAARGSRHILYINRAYFGLFSILNQLKAEIKTTNSYTKK